MRMPIFPLNTVLFPGIPMPIRVFEDRYLKMLSERARRTPAFGVVLIQTGNEVADRPTYHPIGTTARLVSLNAHSSHLVDVVVMGGERIRVGEANWTNGYAVADTETIPDRTCDELEGSRQIELAKNAYASWAGTIARVLNLGFETPDLGSEPARAGYQIASRLPLHAWEQQALLEDDDPLARMRLVNRHLARENALLHRAGVAGVPLPFPGDRFMLN